MKLDIGISPLKLKIELMNGKNSDTILRIIQKVDGQLMIKKWVTFIFGL